MQERDFFTERWENKPADLTCPHCRQKATYSIRWLVRQKKKDLPRQAGAEDRKRFEKARSYMIRGDEQVSCQNNRCRRRFDIPSQQSVIFI